MSHASDRPIHLTQRSVTSATWLAAWMGLLGLGCEGDIGSPAGSLGPQTAGTGAFGPGISGPAESMAARAADDAMRATNPTLFDAALSYFPETNPVPGAARLFRLTRTQLDLTTRALLPAHYKAALAESMPR